MAKRTLTPEQRLQKQLRDREYLRRRREQTPEQRSALEKKKKKAARDKRYREKKKKERTAEERAGARLGTLGLPRKPRKKKKTSQKLTPQQKEEARLKRERARIRRRQREYRKKLKEKREKLAASYLLKEKLQFLWKESLDQALHPTKMVIRVDDLGEVTARFTSLNPDKNFFDLNELINDTMSYDSLVRTGFIQAFATFLETTPDGIKITTPPRASQASAGGVYRRPISTYFYDLSYDEGQCVRCMGTAEHIVNNILEHTKHQLVRDSFGFVYHWNTDHQKPEKGSTAIKR